MKPSPRVLATAGTPERGGGAGACGSPRRRRHILVTWLNRVSLRSLNTGAPLGPGPPRARFAGHRGAARGNNVETPHPAETPHAYNMFYFRTTKSFHVLSACVVMRGSSAKQGVSEAQRRRSEDISGPPGFVPTDPLTVTTAGPPPRTRTLTASPATNLSQIPTATTLLDPLLSNRPRNGDCARQGAAETPSA
jgi:hypothetical protein